MKKVCLTLLGVMGLGLFSQSALANCYCQVGHLVPGNVCVVPQTGVNGQTQMVHLNPICSGGNSSGSSQKPIEFSTSERAVINSTNEMALAFSAKTGQYGLILQNQGRFLRGQNFLTQSGLNEKAMLICTAKSTNTTLEFLSHKRNKRQAQKLIAESGCALEGLKQFGEPYSNLMLYRGQNAQGKWGNYWIQYHLNQSPQAINNAIATMKAQCQSENKSCEYINDFYREGMY